MSLFACSDAIDVSLHDALVAEAGRKETSGSIDIPDFCGLCIQIITVNCKQQNWEFDNNSNTVKKKKKPLLNCAQF